MHIKFHYNIKVLKPHTRTCILLSFESWMPYKALHFLTGYKGNNRFNFAQGPIED